MKKETFSKITFFVINSIFSIILTNLGFFAYNESKAIGILTIMIAFILLYFSFYAFQIRKNEEKIQQIEEKIAMDEKLLNTIKEIVILNKIQKIK
jgi:c-di-AMP phosphodiesterase-like protein